MFVVTAGSCITHSLSLQIVEAYREGKCKPDPRIYKLCLERLDVQPQESIFLDNSSQNLKTAAQLGIKTVKVQSSATRARVWFLSPKLPKEALSLHVSVIRGLVSSQDLEIVSSGILLW